MKLTYFRIIKRVPVSITGFVIACMLAFSTPVAWGAATDSTPLAGSNIQQAATESVRAGDIDISYRITGNGHPLLLITGYSATMDLWDPFMISTLTSRYKVIIFDNRGIGRTTSSDKPFTIELFAEDTIGLMNALGIRKAHILGWSMGAFIATELALKYPERVGKLILYAGNCRWKGAETVKTDPDVSASLMDFSGTQAERSKRLISILYPKKWLEDNPDFLTHLPRPKELPSRIAIEQQGQAIDTWAGTCSRLDKIRQPTLVITGTEDAVIHPGNSLRLASQIPGSWLIRLPGGHANMYQYPGTFSRCILNFLEEEKN